jgi:hypothetical protein
MSRPSLGLVALSFLAAEMVACESVPALYFDAGSDAAGDQAASVEAAPDDAAMDAPTEATDAGEDADAGDGAGESTSDADCLKVGLVSPSCCMRQACDEDAGFQCCNKNGMSMCRRPSAGTACN